MLMLHRAQTAPQKSPPQRWPTLWQRHGPTLVTAVLIAAWLVLALRSLQFFCYEDDEGSFLLTALSMLEGHTLYTEIWHNYLPGLVGLVVASFRIGGISVEAPRVAIVLLGAVTMAATAALAAASGRRWAAPVAAALTLAAPNFVRLSRSVMGEVPANTFALLAALAMLSYHRRRRPLWLLLTGAGVGVATLFKYPAIIMLPVVGAELLALTIRERWPWRRLLGSALLLGLGAALPLLLVAVLIDVPTLYEQLVTTHINASQRYGLRLAHNVERLREYALQNNVGLLPAALLGLGLWFAGKRPGAWLLTAWLGLTLPSILISSPLSSHHLYLLLAPVVALAAVALASAPSLLSRRGRPLAPGPLALGLAGVLCVALVVYHLPGTLELTASRLRPAPDDKSEVREVVALLRERAQPGDQAVCDYPMIVFRAGLSSPPALVNTSGLRMGCADLQADLAIAVTQAQRPLAVIFWDNKFLDHAPEYIAWMQREYVEVMRTEVKEQRNNPPKLRAIYLRPDRAP